MTIPVFKRGAIFMIVFITTVFHTLGRIIENCGPVETIFGQKSGPAMATENGFDRTTIFDYSAENVIKFSRGRSPEPPSRREKECPLSCSPPTPANGTRKTYLMFHGRTTFQKPTTALQNRSGLHIPMKS